MSLHRLNVFEPDLQLVTDSIEVSTIFRGQGLDEVSHWGPVGGGGFEQLQTSLGFGLSSPFSLLYNVSKSSHAPSIMDKRHSHRNECCHAFPARKPRAEMSPSSLEVLLSAISSKWGEKQLKNALSDFCLPEANHSSFLASGRHDVLHQHGSRVIAVGHGLTFPHP